MLTKHTIPFGTETGMDQKLNIFWTFRISPKRGVPEVEMVQNRQFIPTAIVYWH